MTNIPRNFDPDKISHILDRAEKQRYHNFNNDLSRLRFLIGRYMIKTILTNLLDVTPQEIGIELSTQGKPFLSKTSHVQDIDFNITHSKDIVIAAVCCGGKIGIDTERLDRSINIDRISSHYLHSDEHLELQKQDPISKKILFFKLWTLKEAIVKLSGESIFAGIKKIHLSICSKSNEARIINGANKDIGLKIMDYPEHYITSIAYQHTSVRDIKINWHQFYLEKNL